MKHLFFDLDLLPRLRLDIGKALVRDVPLCAQFFLLPHSLLRHPFPIGTTTTTARTAASASTSTTGRELVASVAGDTLSARARLVRLERKLIRVGFNKCWEKVGRRQESGLEVDSRRRMELHRNETSVSDQGHLAVSQEKLTLTCSAKALFLPSTPSCPNEAFHTRFNAAQVSSPQPSRRIVSGVLGSITSGVDAFALPLAAAAAAARRRSLVGPGTGKTEGTPPALVGEA